MRVDPAHVLGIKPGEAVVMRNIGGRITRDLLEQLDLLGRKGEIGGEIPGGGGEFDIKFKTTATLSKLRSLTASSEPGYSGLS